MWDVFISHAWEDKATIARPLAYALQKAGLTVWYDEFTLKLGDSLRRSIDRGLSQSRYGVVILSPYFFAKEWPQRELDGLTAREISSGKVILPVWHNVTRKDVEQFSPVLADRLGVSTTDGLAVVVREILRVASPEESRGSPQAPKPKKKNLDRYKDYIQILPDTLEAYLLDGNDNLRIKVPIRDLTDAMELVDGVKTVILDGVVTQRLLDIAAKRGIDRLVGIKIGNITKKPADLEILTFGDNE